MTKKEEILEKINTMDHENYWLRTISYRVNNFSTLITVFYSLKDNTIDIINTDFSDDLLGHLPGTTEDIKIIDWDTVPKNQN